MGQTQKYQSGFIGPYGSIEPKGTACVNLFKPNFGKNQKGIKKNQVGSAVCCSFKVTGCKQLPPGNCFHVAESIGPAEVFHITAGVFRNDFSPVAFCQLGA